MGINHFDIATEGVRKTHQWIATLGIWNVILDLTIGPVDGYYGDEAEVDNGQPSPTQKLGAEHVEWEDYYPQASKYVVTITVKRNGKKWQIKREFKRGVIEKIRAIANFIAIKRYRTEVFAEFSKKIYKYIKVIAKHKD